MHSALAPDEKALGLLLVTGLVCLACTGCADAAGRFRAFEDRRSSLAGQGQAGATGDAGGAPGCAPPAPGVVAGPALLALDTSTAPGVAILFWGEVETPPLDGQTSVKYSYRAVDATDRRTLLGDALVVGPYAIQDDGSFEAPTPLSTIPGKANAILPGVPITSELTLHGTICGVEQFYCGTITGDVTSPFAGPTSGNFGLTLLASIDDMPERPRFGCAEDALAPAQPE